MKCTISKDKGFKILEWVLFICLGIVSGWFASGVLDQFFSQKTSFAQYEEQVTDYPVIIIRYSFPSEINEEDLKIFYGTKGMLAKTIYKPLKIGENQLYNVRYNTTEKVILEIFETFSGKSAFRLIHATPILERNMANVDIILRYNARNKTSSRFSEIVRFYLTSRANSPGFTNGKWKDGKPLTITMNKDNFVIYNIQPQITKYLQLTGKCQKESYFECITIQLDKMEFNDCPNKCIPNVFSNLGQNYNTAFCQNDTVNEECIVRQIMEQEIGSYCKKSCLNLEYFGEVDLTMPYIQNCNELWSDSENCSSYYLKYTLTNPDYVSKVYEEYYIYDTIGMMGSVGGTLGI